MRLAMRAAAAAGITLALAGCGDAIAPTGPRAVPSAPAFQAQNAGPAVTVSAGSSTSCAVTASGAVVCWGSDVFGLNTPPAGTFAQVTVGEDVACALSPAGTVVCWGALTTPAGTFTQVSAGRFHACAVETDGTVVCWGESSFDAHRPPAGSFTQVSAGELHSCGVRTDGSIACWGSDRAGSTLPPAGTFTQVSVGQFHTCAVRTDGTVACWGRNDSGESTPPAGTFTQVSAGIAYTCGVRTVGTVACWGANFFGVATPPAELADDLTPPAITVPADVAVNATSPAGAAVSYTVTVTDNVGVASQSCAPASGSVFAIGTTSVTCIASDAAGNTASASFSVTVKGAPEQIQDLDATIDGLELHEGTETSLQAKLDAAMNSFASGDVSAACGQLGAMVNQIAAQTGKKISAADAADLIADVERIRAVIGCGS